MPQGQQELAFDAIRNLSLCELSQKRQRHRRRDTQTKSEKAISCGYLPVISQQAPLTAAFGVTVLFSVSVEQRLKPKESSRGMHDHIRGYSLKIAPKSTLGFKTAAEFRSGQEIQNPR
jgi:hypothetical protein